MTHIMESNLAEKEIKKLKKKSLPPTNELFFFLIIFTSRLVILLYYFVLLDDTTNAPHIIYALYTITPCTTPCTRTSHT